MEAPQVYTERTSRAHRHRHRHRQVAAHAAALRFSCVVVRPVTVGPKFVLLGLLARVVVLAMSPLIVVKHVWQTFIKRIKEFVELLLGIVI